MNATSRPRALFICANSPYPGEHGLALRQAAQIEALASEYDVTVAPKTAPTSSAQIPQNIKISVDPMTTRPSIFPQRSSRAVQFDKALDAFRLNDVLKQYLYLFELLYDPFSPKLQNTRRAHYLSCLESGPFDLVWVSRLETAWSIGPIGPIPCVLDMDDLESSARQSTLRLEGRRSGVDSSDASQVARISQIERELGLDYNIVTLTSTREVEKIGLANARVLRNCIPPNSTPSPCQTSDSKRILFIGILEYLPNLHGMCWFLDQVWPELISHHPTAFLDIVGKCFDADQQPSLVLPPNVRLHGFVKDISSIWEAAAVLIVPVFAGGGTRTKILEAWGRGVPVVTTAFGVAGLEAVDGVHMLTANTSGEFAEKCAALFSSPALRDSLVLAGQDLVRSQYSRDKIMSSIRLIAQEARTCKPPRESFVQQRQQRISQ